MWNATRLCFRKVLKTLHIADGDSTAGTIRLSGLARGDEILSWRDALYTGPVPDGLSLHRLSRVRSRFLTDGANSKELEKRDAALAKHAEFEHVALWFGPNCVLCQLSLVQLLSWFREQGVSASRLSWIAGHGGELPPERIAMVYSKRKSVTLPQMRLAERAWRAFRQPSPAAMSRLLRSDLGAIPGLSSALTRLLQEYPSSRTGLSRLETLLLRTIQRAGSVRAALIVGSIIAKETVGDTMLFDMLRNFFDASHPLVEHAKTEDPKGTKYHYGSTLKLTDDGKCVLAGKRDAIHLNGIDRWIGGVHLRGRHVPWRWDRGTKRIRAA